MRRWDQLIEEELAGVSTMQSLKKEEEVNLNIQYMGFTMCISGFTSNTLLKGFNIRPYVYSLRNYAQLTLINRLITHNWNGIV